jgi:hypothetical protein
LSEFDDLTPEDDEDGEVSDVEYLDECHCADDWGVGNLGVVAVCYLNMCRDAMEHLAAARQELAKRDDEIAALRIQLADQA